MAFCPAFFIEDADGFCIEDFGTIFDFGDPTDPIGGGSGGGGSGGGGTGVYTTCINPVTGARRLIDSNRACPPGFFPLFTGTGTGTPATGFECDIICLLLIAIGLMVLSDV
jgi:hypothetical protein